MDNCSALASMKERRDWCEDCAVVVVSVVAIVDARLRPSSSMSGFISATVTFVRVSPCTFLAWSSNRNAMSPVPPATSRMCMPLSSRLSLSRAADGLEGSWPRPGSSERTKWSFHRRWMPRDMRSFMVSYLLATEEKTLPTGNMLYRCKLLHALL